LNRPRPTQGCRVNRRRRRTTTRRTRTRTGTRRTRRRTRTRTKVNSHQFSKIWLILFRYQKTNIRKIINILDIVYHFDFLKALYKVALFVNGVTHG
jgi:hypothetical protein